MIHYSINLCLHTRAYKTGEFFARHEWEFEVSNVHELVNEVQKTSDRDDFKCDVTKINWDEYLKMFVLGIRKYVLKDDESTLEKSRNTVKMYVVWQPSHHQTPPKNNKFIFISFSIFRLFIVKWTVQMFFIILTYFLIQKLF